VLLTDREGKKRAKELLSDLRISAGADTTRKTVRDPRDGRVYPIVALGGNTWLAQNLEFQSDLGKCTPGTMKLCFQYGGYYDLASAREACMPGWRLSTAADWTALLDAVADKRTLKGPEMEGTNQTGFHATPGGAVYPQASMAKLAFSQEGYFWEDIDGNGAMNKRNTEYGEADFERLPASRDDRYSVRCVLGQRPTPPARGLTPAPNPAPVHGGRITDTRDGQIYRVTRIGGHNWLARNLNYAGPSGDAGMCYDNRTSNCATMGRLYDWRSAAGLPKPFNEKEYGLGPGHIQGLCPEGWFLPNIEDWIELASAASSQPSMDLAGQAQGGVWHSGASDCVSLKAGVFERWIPIVVSDDHGNGTYAAGGFAAWIQGNLVLQLLRHAAVGGAYGADAVYAVAETWLACNVEARPACRRELVAWGDTDSRANPGAFAASYPNGIPIRPAIWQWRREATVLPSGHFRLGPCHDKDNRSVPCYADAEGVLP
jgi:uncharacterized protein (TIGR02145 family)